MNQPDLQAILAQGESMTVEFKSDQGPLSDTDLVETAVCLANGQGGTLLVGVEDPLRSRKTGNKRGIPRFVQASTRGQV